MDRQRALLVSLAGLLLLGGSCMKPRRVPSADGGRAGAASAPAAAGDRDSTPVFIDADFRSVYQIMLLTGLSPAEKSVLWSRYYKQRWVLWSGQVAYLTNYQVRLRHMEGTLTYDVNLELSRATGRPLSALTIGRFYNYVGRMVRYDEDFGIIYLDQGVVYDVGPLGVPGMLDSVPETTRQVPEPPKVIPVPVMP